MTFRGNKLSGVTHGDGEGNYPICQGKCWNRAPLSLYFFFIILLVFSRLCLFALFRIFSGDFGFHFYYSYPHSDLTMISQVF